MFWSGISLDMYNHDMWHLTLFTFQTSFPYEQDISVTLLSELFKGNKTLTNKVDHKPDPRYFIIQAAQFKLAAQTQDYSVNVWSSQINVHWYLTRDMVCKSLTWCSTVCRYCRHQAPSRKVNFCFLRLSSSPGAGSIVMSGYDDWNHKINMLVILYMINK